ncbi:MAG: relaxase/mobilization nuclease domain-containing protein [Lachnospiraceae bacterium]|nr:relaxase/mobilization nuclease domain-containing protein [Lachnospiraceae bacterium]
MHVLHKLLENKYSYVIATHIDKEHCHNHIIFCFRIKPFYSCECKGFRCRIYERGD